MASDLPVETTRLKEPDPETIKEMIHIYQEAYRNDKSIQLQHILPALTNRMAETLTSRTKKPECEFLLARSKTSHQIIGWLALAFKLDRNQQLSEEHVLLTQYALLPDIVAKSNRRGIPTEKIALLAHTTFQVFKTTREAHLRSNHCILSTLVVTPSHQNAGVASALLSHAITLTEVFAFPIWVPAPPASARLFQKHQFHEVGEYGLDLESCVPEDDGKGKASAASGVGKYSWKFMVREEPLEQAGRAYRASKVFAEQEAAQEGKGEVRAGKGKTPGQKLKSAAGSEAGSKAAEALDGGDGEQASEERLITLDDAGEGSSVPLLAKLSVKGDREGETVDRAAKEAMYS